MSPVLSPAFSVLRKLLEEIHKVTIFVENFHHACALSHPPKHLIDQVDSLFRT
jgi:hypothetical protein